MIESLIFCQEKQFSFSQGLHCFKQITSGALGAYLSKHVFPS